MTVDLGWRGVFDKDFERSFAPLHSRYFRICSIERAAEVIDYCSNGAKVTHASLPYYSDQLLYTGTGIDTVDNE